MKFDSVLVLPLLAVALAIFFRVYKNHPNYSKSIKSRKHRKILLGRYTVLVLLLTTVVALFLSFQGMSKLQTALLLSAILVAPAYLAHLLMTLRNPNSGKSNQRARKTSNEYNSNEYNEPSRVPEGQFSRTHSSNETIEQSVSDPTFSEFDRSDRPAIDLTTESNATHHLPSAETSNSRHASDLLVNYHQDTPADIQEQLDRASELVKSYDIGETDYLVSEEDLEQSRHKLTADEPVSIDSALTIVNISNTELSTMSTGEISNLITSLRIDKTRLQKLVIAQQSAIESERTAHDQSRIVARDAIKIMRDAREGQKLAEKIARRERAQRQRVELQYRKVEKALNNAMSIIEARKSENA